MGGFCFFNCEELGYDAVTGLVSVVQPRTVPACHLGGQVLVVSNYLSKLNMLEVSAGTLWQLKYTGYIFGRGTIMFGNFIPKPVLGGEALKKSTPFPMALWASLPACKTGTPREGGG